MDLAIAVSPRWFCDRALCDDAGVDMLADDAGADDAVELCRSSIGSSSGLLSMAWNFGLKLFRTALIFPHAAAGAVL